MRVLFLIYNTTMTNGGGSFHSLYAHVTSMKSKIEPIVINLGFSPSDTIKSLPKYKFVPFIRWNIKEFFSLLRIVKNTNPSVINAYDEKSLFVGRLLSLIFNIPIIYTKCGGVNGSKVIPFASKYILYSGENFEHYKQYGSIKRALLIPNRVLRPKVDKLAVKQFLKYLNIKQGRILLRISRFNRYYDLTFNQTFELFRNLSAEEEGLHLVYLGLIQDKKYFDELKFRFNYPNVHFVTDKRFTDSAAKLIPAVDYIVATGRGAMEACAYGKRVFCPTAIGKVPVELTKESFPIISYYNFSERASIAETTVSTSLFSTKELFDTYFCTDAVTGIYANLYLKMTSQSAERIRNLSSLFYHALQFYRPRW